MTPKKCFLSCSILSCAKLLSVNGRLNCREYIIKTSLDSLLWYIYLTIFMFLSLTLVCKTTASMYEWQCQITYLIHVITNTRTYLQTDHIIMCIKHLWVCCRRKCPSRFQNSRIDALVNLTWLSTWNKYQHNWGLESWPIYCVACQILKWLIHSIYILHENLIYGVCDWL